MPQDALPCHFERLEDRRLLAGAPVIHEAMHGLGCSCAMCAQAAQLSQVSAKTEAAAVTPSLTMRVSFQPASATTVADGFRTDLGRAFGTRANGLAYGWNTDVSSGAVMRPFTLETPEEQNRGNIAMPANSRWEVAVPNGTYKVRVVAGDSQTTSNAVYKVKVEGTEAITQGDGVPFNDLRFYDGQAIVNVTDGRITLTRGTGASNLKLSYVEIFSYNRPPTTSTTWETSPYSYPGLGRVEAGKIEARGRVFYLGGYYDAYAGASGQMWQLTLSNGKWKRLASLPNAQTHFGTTYDGTYIYTAAGQIGALDNTLSTNEVWRYNVSGGSWERFTNLPVTRFAGQLQYHNGTNSLYYFGGDNTTRRQAQTAAWKLDLSNPNADWTPIASMPEAVDHHAAVVVGNKIYSIGGETDHGKNYVQRDEVYVYDIPSNTWSFVTRMPQASSHLEASVQYIDNKLFIFAGKTFNNSRYADVRSYDLATGVWREYSDYPVNAYGGITFKLGNTVQYITGDTQGLGGEPRGGYAMTLPATTAARLAPGIFASDRTIKAPITDDTRVSDLVLL